RALRFGNEAYARARHPGDVRQQAEALFWTGKAYREQKVYAQAIDRLGRSVELFRSLKDERRMADAWLRLAYCRKDTSQHDAAIHAYREAVAAYDRAGDRAGVAQATYDLGLTYWHLGR